MAALVLAAVAACGAEPPQTGPETPTPSTEAVPVSDADRAAAPGLAERFLQAANAGDSAAVAALFAEDARFDSVGRIYPSRRDIMDRFLDPEVIEAGGRYTVTGSGWYGDRYRVEYDYDTGHGGKEVFYYDYLVRDGLIQDVIGRYS
ncbi:nuclear transport factor 2 family protein [Saccharothrix syringae]|uniref:nuclear transport factor 2 family protein n=1 Tax=Saccharothrix syringae TaxID=103733 RepID=UPI0005247F9D|nr:nuclear transport factor 2 family protein [Saccharothrix syringae]